MRQDGFYTPTERCCSKTRLRGAPCPVGKECPHDEDRVTMCAIIPAPSDKPVAGIDATLAERGARYGKFTDHAEIAEAFISLAMSFKGWERLAPDMRQSFRMFADKQARILSGDPDYSDSWHDIAGYATLVDKRLKEAGK